MADDAPGAGNDGEGDGVPWLDPEELEAWISLVALLELLPSAIDAQLKRDAGVNLFEYSILAGLSESADRTMPMSQLALFVSGSLSRLSHAISRLESKGWVERVASGSGRQTDVRLTDVGWDAITGFAPAHVREARRLVVDVLSRRQLTDLGRASRDIIRAVDPDSSAALEETIRRVTGR